MHKRSPELLVIDDDPNVFEMLTPTLDFCSLRPVFSKQSLKATLQKVTVDGVSLDYKMGSKKGTDFIPLIRQYCPHAFIILLTAYGTKAVLIEALQHSLTDYIEKPMKLDEVKACIIKHLEPRFGQAISNVQYQAEIDAIKTYVDDLANASDDYNLEQYCMEKNLNYKYLSRLFKEQEGISFREYKLNKKIDFAKQLLLNTPLTISEISNRLHYMNPSAFMKMFKTEVGMTPTAFRKQGI